MNYQEFRRQGFSFALRYVVPSIPGKSVSLSEIGQAHAADIDVAFIYETTGQTWQGGFSAGKLDGESAYAAMRALGAPVSCAVYHAVDQQVFPSAMSRVIDWARGLIAGMGPYRIGIYGEFDVVEAVAHVFPDLFRWQTKAWSSGRISQQADVLQLGTSMVGNLSIDIDVAYQPHIGQWYANPQNQPEPSQGDEMPSGDILPNEVTGRPIKPGSATAVYLYADIGLNGGFEQSCRVALHSEAKGYTQIVEAKLLTAQPYVINMEEHDVDAVSFDRRTEGGSFPLGFLIA
jgi:hypothetical protein